MISIAHAGPIAGKGMSSRSHMNFHSQQLAHELSRIKKLDKPLITCLKPVEIEDVTWYGLCVNDSCYTYSSQEDRDQDAKALKLECGQKARFRPKVSRKPEKAKIP